MFDHFIVVSNRLQKSSIELRATCYSKVTRNNTSIGMGNNYGIISI